MCFCLRCIPLDKGSAYGIRVGRFEYQRLIAVTDIQLDRAVEGIPFFRLHAKF